MTYNKQLVPLEYNISAKKKNFLQQKGDSDSCHTNQEKKSPKNNENPGIF